MNSMKKYIQILLSCYIILGQGQCHAQKYRKNNLTKAASLQPIDSAITSTHQKENDLSISNIHEKQPRHNLTSCKPERPTCPLTSDQNIDDTLEVNFENTDITNMLKWISEVFNVTFLTTDIFQPLPQGAKGLEGNKITFQTHKPMNKKEVWELFLTFLDLFGFSIVETAVKHVYSVKPTAANDPNTISRSPLSSYINIDWHELPQTDEFIRYIYYIKNSSLANIQPIINAFRSTSATLKPLQDQNAFIITDKSLNIRSIMQVIQELDRASMPEAMSVLKLKNADAEEVVKLYNNLTKAEDPRGMAARLLGTRKQPTSVYFPENLRIIAERRNNLLIILGDAQGIKKVEEFIIDYVDTELKVPYSPLFVYELQYTNAEDMANILNNVVKFAQSTSAAQSGGVREGDKYLQAMSIVPEPAGNRLLIKAEKEDYLKVRDVIRKLDIKQPQVAIEVLIVNVISSDNRQLGVQIRNKDSSTVSKNLDFQNSGLFREGTVQSAPVVDQENGSLVANLISLAEGQSPGATLLTIANAASGVWGIFKVLQTYVSTQLISNPFLITTNKYTAEASIGETRRVLTGEVKGTRDASVLGDVVANLTIKITPQINKIGIINLDVEINIDTFSDAQPTSANRETKTLRTNTNVGNKEVLVLGGLLQNTANEDTSKVPLFGDVPFLGWFFKNKNKTKVEDNLIVFISPRIVEPQLEGGIDNYTFDKADIAKDSLCLVRQCSEKRDPIHRWFFKDKVCEQTDTVDNFLAQKHDSSYLCVKTTDPCCNVDSTCEPPCAYVDNSKNSSVKNPVFANIKAKKNSKSRKQRLPSILQKFSSHPEQDQECI